MSYELGSLGTNGKGGGSSTGTPSTGTPSGEPNAWLQSLQQQREEHPYQFAAATVPLCALVSLLPGAIIGAIASPKGERGGGAKWGALAYSATCLLQIPAAQMGSIGSVLVWMIGIGAAIGAARYRLNKVASEKLSLKTRSNPRDPRLDDPNMPWIRWIAWSKSGESWSPVGHKTPLLGNRKLFRQLCQDAEKLVKDEEAVTSIVKFAPGDGTLEVFYAESHPVIGDKTYTKIYTQEQLKTQSNPRAGEIRY